MSLDSLKKTTQSCSLVKRFFITTTVKPRCKEHSSSDVWKNRFLYFGVDIAGQFTLSGFLISRVLNFNERGMVVDFQKFTISKSRSSTNKYSGGSRGRVQGVRTPRPSSEDLFLVFAFKICLLDHSITPFLSGAPLQRKKSWIRP